MHRAIRTSLVIGLLASAALTARPAAADLIVFVESVAAGPGSMGNHFDVTLANTGPSAVALDAFSFGLQVDGSALALTGATTATASAPYIFDSRSFFGPDLATQTGATLVAADLDAGVDVYSLAAGATVGLGRVAFDVLATDPGVFAVTLLPSPDTGLAFGGDDVPIAVLLGGTVTVVPEPASITLLTIALGSGLVCRRLLGRNRSR
jgi:hypothetical protein